MLKIALSGKMVLKFKEHLGHYKIHKKSFFRDTAHISLEEGNPCIYRIKAKQNMNSLKIELLAFKDEYIFGGGEHFSRINLKGKAFPLWVQEQGVGRGYNLISFLASLKGIKGTWYSSYFPLPVFISTKNYGIVIDCYGPIFVDFRKKEQSIFEIFSNEVKLLIFRGNLKQLVKDISNYLGRQKELPDWVYGVWLALQGGKEIVQKKVQFALKEGIPISAIWCQDWSGRKITSFGKQVYWNWLYDEKMYPNLPELIKELRERKIHFLGYVNPFLIKGGTLYEEARKNGYLVMSMDGKVYDVYVTTFPVGLIDLTNPEAFEWYKNILKQNMIDIGMSGWMADFGEYLPVNCVLYSREDPILYHNKYPVEWARLNYEAMKESSRNDLIFFMRSGYIGSSRYCPLVWAGDQNVDWSKSDGIPTVIPSMISMGYSGILFHHFDAGGFTSLFWLRRDDELFMRWVEIASFSLIFRTHETNRPIRNVQFDTNEKILRHFIRMSRVHFYLKDYLKDQVKKAIENGIPVIRHPLIDFPSDFEVSKIIYQYMLGEDIMVAPVLKRKTHKWRVYLPANMNWYHIWTKKKFKGGTFIEVDSPLGKPPVFIKEDSQYIEYILEMYNYV